MKKWEYKIEFRERSADHPSPWNIDIPAKLNDLGADGWELVSVAPRSKGHHGYTTEELWVFKREVD